MKRIAQVITVSDRSAAGARVDRSGPLAADLLGAAGWTVKTTIVPDEIPRIVEAIQAASATGARLILTTGGTGVSHRDVTPEATAGLLERQLPGISEEVRRVGATKVPTALISRGLAGILARALVVNLAGSTGAVRDGIPVVIAVAEHVLAQLDGKDHA